MREHIFHFCGPITPKSYENLRNLVLSAFCQGGAEKITVMLSSEGGDLNSGFSAYNFFRGLPVPVKMVNVGTVESIAVLIYLASDERIALESSRFLIHPFHWTFPSGRVDYPRLNENSDSLLFDIGRYINIFNERTNCGNGLIDVSKCLNGQSVIIDASTSTKNGISSAVIPVVNSIPMPSETVIHWWTTSC